jgi:hypothetical protein
MEVINHPAKEKTIHKGRRWGFTQGMMNYCIEQLAEGLSPILWVDTVNTNIDRYVERYGMPVLKQLPQEHWKWRQQKKELNVFGNVMDLRSADQPENIEGFGYKLIVLNEAGIILKNEYLYYNTILPMIMDFDPMRIIGGTPKGRNVFHKLSTKASDPMETDRADFHFSSYDNPFLAKEVIDKIADEMPSLVRKQEIYAEFLEDEAVVFKNVKACIAGGMEEPIDGMTYYMGVDLARLVDYTVITVFDENGKMVHFNRFNKIDWPYQKRLIKNTAAKYNNASTLIDSTGVGDPILKDLEEMGVYVEGYKFDNTSKKKLIESLMMAFEMGHIQIIDDPTLINELLIFEYQISKSGVLRYEAPQGYHDDCVISLALANWCWDKAVSYSDMEVVMV